jgi:hypothetical protein
VAAEKVDAVARIGTGIEAVVVVEAGVGVSARGRGSAEEREETTEPVSLV